MPATKKAPSETTIRARQLVAEISRMTESERTALASRIPTLINPDGHPLSIRNTILLAMQSGRSDLTIVAGFRQWRDHGRCVRKGERSIGCITVPLSWKAREKDGAEKRDPNTGENVMNLRFRLVPVFDISQTDAELAVTAAS